MLKIFKTRNEWLNFKETSNIQNLGFVPTMGNLHLGHLSLIEESFKHHSQALISIFVNPTQFNSAEDLKNYPRTLSADLELLESLMKNYQDRELFVFAPHDKSEVYPQDFDTQIIPGRLAEKLCGAYRPGHFSGVCSVVYCLLKLAGATAAYFGEKDFQQYLIIKKMADDLALPTKIISCPLIRDARGLALSSRNNRLNESQKEQALKLHYSLKSLLSLLEHQGITNAWDKRKEIMSEDKNFEYLEILDAKDLENCHDQTEHYIIAGAYYVGGVRLIDNITYKRGKKRDA